MNLRSTVNILLAVAYLSLLITGSFVENGVINIHRMFALCCAMLIIIHLYQRRNWLMNIKVRIKTTYIQVCLGIATLTALLSGMLGVTFRIGFLVDIHSGVVWVALICAAAHIFQKRKWFINMVKKNKHI